jgi:hypothetical protein
MRYLGAVLLVAGAIVAAGPAVRAQVVAASPMMAVPDEPGGWMLHILTRGGIMGGGAGEVIILSDGRMTCRQPARTCVPTIGADALVSLREQIRLASVEAWQTRQPATVCSDCLITDLALTSRNADGTLTTLRASWDPTTRAKLAAAITRVHDLAARLAQPLTR